MRMRLSVFWLVLLTIGTPLFAVTASAKDSVEPNRTIVADQAAKKRLLGSHMFSLQWISWDYFGKVTVTDRKGLLVIKGEQKSRTDSDFVTIDGVITRVDKREFTFVGKIVTQISHINNGSPCTREGEMTFKITGNRQYWRLASMDNPCDPVTDYVDVFFRAR